MVCQLSELPHSISRFIDEVLAGIKNGELKGPFTCDGQFSMLDDYLAVCPDKRDAVVSALKQKNWWQGHGTPSRILTVYPVKLIRNFGMGISLIDAWAVRRRWRDLYVISLVRCPRCHSSAKDLASKADSSARH